MSTIEFTKGLIGHDYFKAEVLSEEEQNNLDIKRLCKRKVGDGFSLSCTLVPQIPVVDASLLTKIIRVHFYSIPKPYVPGSTHMEFALHFTVENYDNERNITLFVKVKAPKLNTWYRNAADYVCTQLEKECFEQMCMYYSRPNNDYKFVACTYIEIWHCYGFWNAARTFLF